MKIVFFAAFLMLIQVRVFASPLSSIILSDAKSQQVIGTASNLCVSLQQDALYYVTAAHVVEGVDEIRGGYQVNQQTRVLKKVKVDSEMDLALLRSEPNFFDGMTPCWDTPFMFDPEVPKVFDVLGIKNPTLHPLEIEGYDSDLKALRTELVSAPLVKSIQSGLPGRDDLGSVYMTTFKARPGFSGGLVLSYSDEYYKDYVNIKPGQKLDPAGFGVPRVMVGIVTAAEPINNRVAIIPIHTIMTWILNLDHRPDHGETVVATYQGLYNKEIKAFVSTPQDTFISVGLSSFGGVGTGRPSVGISGTRRGTGVILEDQPDREWLSINDTWIEGDPLNAASKKSMQGSRQNLGGVYRDTKGQLMKTAGSPFPRIIGVNEINKVLGQTDPECSRVQLLGNKSQKLMPAQVCERLRPGKAEYSLNSKDVNLMVSLNETLPNQVSVKAEMNSRPAEALSLRRMQNERYSVKFEGLSGIEIQDRKTGEIWVGP